MRYCRWVGIVGSVVLALGWCGASKTLGAVTPGGDTTVGSDVGQSTFIGKDAVGTLGIDGGSSLKDAAGYVGYNAGSNGTATVTGAASNWTNISNYVGYSGTGTMNIEAGGQVKTSWGYLGCNLGSTGTLNVTGAGSGWTTSSSLYVGYDGSGTLTVADGGLVTAKSLYASPGDLRGNGTISVNGAVMDVNLVFDNTHGSTQALVFGTGGTLNLTINGANNLGVGYKGGGSLRVADGVTVTSGTGYLGYRAGSAGAATVSGTGSTWVNNDILYVGKLGSGRLTVTDGGAVSTKTLYASLNTLLGNGTITVNTGAILDANLVFDSTHGTTQTIGFGSGGALNLTVGTTGDLGVGYKGDGSLRIADGAAVASNTGYLGYHTNSTGAATVNGTGSTWTIASNFYVGYSGNGALSIDGGARIITNSSSAYIGYEIGSAGTVTVSGAGSQWTSNSSLYVGRSGCGTLIIEGGGQVTTRGGYIGHLPGSAGSSVTVKGAGSTWALSSEIVIGSAGGGTLNVVDGGVVAARSIYASLSDLLGNGTITAKGAVLDTSLAFDSTHGMTQTLDFGSGGKLHLTVDGTGTLGAGFKGNGNLRVADGVTITSPSGMLGNNAGSTGSAIVRGAGSTWTISSNLYVGSSGNGTLDIEAGGQVGSGSTYLGYKAGSTGTATVTGAGSKWTNSSLYVGDSGSGTLTVTDGGVVTAGTLYASVSNLAGNGTITANAAILDANLVFDSTPGTPVVLAFGNGGTLNVTGTSTFGIGYKASGTMSITKGAAVTTNMTYLGFRAGSMGAATVSGTGSVWNTSTIRIGDLGSGTLTIEAGGKVNGYGDRTIGASYNSAGRVTVTGAGSTWATANSTLYVGYNGSATLIIENGGQVSNSNGFIALNDLSVATATVSGSGSRWTNGSYLYVGRTGDGTLAIDGGGQVSNTDGHIAYNPGSNGKVSVRGPGSTWTNTAGLNVGTLGSGTLIIEAGGQVISAYGRIAGAGGKTCMATVRGAGSRWNNSSSLTVGSFGNGFLTIEAGGQVTNTDGYLGYSAGSTGTATVTGLGSTWTNSSALYVGNIGSGTLTVSDGGAVTAKTLCGSLSNLLGNGTLTVTAGAVLDADLLFDGTHGITQTITFGTGGALNLTVSATGILGAGYKDIGNLRITDGVTVASSTAYLGYHYDSTGSATVDGLGSKWNNSGYLYVGYNGSGTLNITAGGMVSGDSAFLGIQSGSTGTANVSGAGSKWTCSGVLTVYSGGTLTISNGGLVTVGGNLTNSGNITVGAGSNLTVTGGVTQSAGQTVVQGTITVGQTSNVAINGGSFQVDGSLVGSSGVTVTGASSKFVANANQTVKALTVNNGVAEVGLANNASGYKVLSSGSVTLTGTGTVQLHHGGLMIDYSSASPMAAVRAAVVSGFHGGDWGGSGIVSSVALALPNDRAVGYAEAVDVGSPATFLGVAVPDATTLLVRMTIKGDANLDGGVDFADLVAVAQNYNSATLNLPWSKGDFNYDGLVNFGDLVAVAQHYSNTLGSPAAIPGAPADFATDWVLARETGVPEPGVVLLLAGGGVILMRRRR